MLTLHTLRRERKAEILHCAEIHGCRNVHVFGSVATGENRPNMADSDIAEEIFRDYKFTAVVDATQPARDEIDHTEIQRGTDIQFLQSLAMRNGFECYLELNPDRKS